MPEHYRSFNHYLQETFGCRVHRLSLNAGFGCPNLDGPLSLDGCIFCDNRAFSRYARTQVPLKNQIEDSMSAARKRFKAEKFIAYFQSFSSTHASPKILLSQYSVIRDFPDIVGLAVSTRPDCVDEEKLDVLAGFTKDYKVYVEYGLQSANDATLKSINRNHDFAAFCRAVAMSVNRNIDLAVHVMLGLPGETRQDMLDTAKKISQLPLWGIKFHCLHVIKGTKLEELYRNGEIKLLSQAEYADILVEFLRLIPRDWVILRLVSDADPAMLVAPDWINRKQETLTLIEQALDKK